MTQEPSPRFADDTVHFMENMLRVARDLIDSQKELIEIVEALQTELAAVTVGRVADERPSVGSAPRAEARPARSPAVEPAPRSASTAAVSETLKDEARALRRSLDAASAAHVR